MKWNQAFFILFFCAASARGGEPGSRLAGSPQGSPLVRDLRAVRKGDKVTLTWSRTVLSNNPRNKLRFNSARSPTSESKFGQELFDVVKYRFQRRRFGKKYFRLPLVISFENGKRFFGSGKGQTV